MYVCWQMDLQSSLLVVEVRWGCPQCRMFLPRCKCNAACDTTVFQSTLSPTVVYASQIDMTDRIYLDKSSDE